MKKIFLFLAMLSINSVYASERPNWYDICPQGMHYAKYKDVKWFWPDDSRATQEIYNYWAKKRVEFDHELEFCDNKSENFRDVCYVNLKSRYSTDYEIFQRDFENKRISNQIIKDTRKINSGVMFNILPK